MRTETDRQLILTFNWMQNTLRARQDQDHKQAMIHMAEAERLFREVVDAPVTAREQTDELPAHVARLDRAKAAVR